MTMCHIGGEFIALTLSRAFFALATSAPPLAAIMRGK